VKRARKLSEPQLRMLVGIETFGDPWHYVHGAAAHGGASGTLNSLKRGGLIVFDTRYAEGFEWHLTDAGRAELEAARAGGRVYWSAPKKGKTS
jgi:hypothetical protein